MSQYVVEDSKGDQMEGRSNRLHPNALNDRPAGNHADCDELRLYKSPKWVLASLSTGGARRWALGPIMALVAV